MDIKILRKRISGIENQIHFNNAGCSFPDHSVFEAIEQYINLEKSRDGYQLQFSKEIEIDNIYGLLAELIHSNPNEIAITQGASDSIIKALYAIPFQPGDRILTSPWEYGTNYLNYMWLRDKKGIQIDVIPLDKNGDMDKFAAKKLIRSSTRLISITHVPTSSGVVADIDFFGTLAEENDILYLVDACQSVGQIPLDVRSIKCDFLAATSRKYMRGPRGYGFLYVNEQALEKLDFSFLNMIAAHWTGPDSYTFTPSAKTFETWEKSLSILKGFEEAVRVILEIGVDEIWDSVKSLSSYFRSEITKVEGFKVQDTGSQLCGIVTFTHESKSSEYIAKKLSRNHINSTISYNWASFTEMDLKQIGSANRTSIHFFNTKEEIDACISVLKSIK